MNLYQFHSKPETLTYYDSELVQSVPELLYYGFQNWGKK